MHVHVHVVVQMCMCMCMCMCLCVSGLCWLFILLFPRHPRDYE